VLHANFDDWGSVARRAKLPTVERRPPTSLGLWFVSAAERSAQKGVNEKRLKWKILLDGKIAGDSLTR
jgi:hypothetical protein